MEPSKPRSFFKLSLLQRVILALGVVGLLPFLASFFQIRTGREAMIVQTQATHGVAARAAADRVAAYLELLRSVSESTANHPAVYTEPGSLAAAEELKALLEVRLEVLAAGIYLAGDKPELFQIAYRPGAREIADRVLAPQMPAALVPFRAEAGLYLQLRVPTPDARVVLLVVVDTTTLSNDFVPIELGEQAELFLLNANRDVLVGRRDALQDIPENFMQQAVRLGSGVSEVTIAGGQQIVCAYADIADSSWLVLSRQPLSIAAAAATAMQRGTWQAFGAVLLAVVALAFGAYSSIIRPLHRLAESQKRLLGPIEAPQEEGEIAQLEASFAALERNLDDREALSKVFLGRYQVIEVLGAGAMGTVFRGWDTRLERYVALKTIKAGEHWSEEKKHELAEGLKREALTLAKIQNPHIVTIFDTMEEGSAAFIAMELVAGESLEGYIWRRYKLDVGQVIPLGASILKALGAAHQQGIVHHDVKPGNVLLGRNGAIKVTDFGISEMISQASRNEGTVFGTPGYLAPECLAGDRYTEASDIFSVGVVLYRCLTGEEVFPGASIRQKVMATIRKEVPPPDLSSQKVPEGFVDLLMSLLAKLPGERPDDAMAVASQLDAMAAEIGAAWSPEFPKEKIDAPPPPRPPLRSAFIPTTRLPR